MSAACLTSLEQIIPRLEKTHIMAKQIASRVQEIGYQLTLPVDTNMVFVDLKTLGIKEKSFVEYCAREGVLVFEYHRIVVHHQITQEAVDKLIHAMTRLMEDVKSGNLKQ